MSHQPCYCINPNCSDPGHQGNNNPDIKNCIICGAELLLNDKYRASRLLSNNSGFGIVFEVFKGFDAKILKILKPQFNQNSKVIDLFKREYDVLDQLTKQGITGVPQAEDYFIYHHKSSQNHELLLHCLVMEKVEGMNLKEWVEIHGKINQKQALKWLKEIVLILDKIHQLNWFHRDIKPPNIMMRNTGELVLIDFGTAREETQSYYQNLQEQNITGIISPGYTPIEQQNGEAVNQSDFFALGRTFVYLLTGKHPLDQSIFDRINDEFNWQKHTENVNPLLLNIIDNLMSRLAKDRPANTQIILRKLADIEEYITTLPPIQKSIESTTLPLESSLITKYLEKSETSETSTIKQKTPIPTTEKPKHHQLKQIILIGGGLLLTLIGSEIYGYIRYGIFPSSPVFIISTFPSSHFLDKTLTGHSNFINSVNFSPDGKFLASGSDDNTIKIWDVDSGKELRTLKGHSNWVRTVNFSPDGQLLASGSWDKTIKIWDVNTGKELHTLKGHSQWVRTVNFSPDGQFLASGSRDKNIKIWDVNTGKELRTLKGHSHWIRSVNFSPDGQFLASGGLDKTIKIWEVSTGKELRTLKGHTDWVSSVNFSPDGKFLASGSGDNTIKIWEVSTGKELQSFIGHSNWVRTVNFSADGRFLASGGLDKTIKIWEVNTGKELQTLKGHYDWVGSVNFSADGRFLASGSDDKTIKIWRLR